MKLNLKTGLKPVEQSDTQHAPADEVTAKPGECLRQTLECYDVRGEKLIALGQIAFAGLILTLQIVAQIRHEFGIFNALGVSALVALTSSSLLRFYTVQREWRSERFRDVLTVIDITSLLVLLGSYQLAYHHPLASSLKAPSFVILFVLIALRALRLNPRPVLISGITAASGWTILLLLAVILEGTDAITQNYTEYLTSHKILIGAEFEKIVGILALTGFIALATGQAREIIGIAAREEDYARALALSEENMKNATMANLKAHKALKMLSKSEKQHKSKNEQFNAVLENMSQGVAMFDDNRRLVVCNKRYMELYELPMELTEPGTSLNEILECRIKSGIYHDSPKEYLQEWLAIPEEKKTDVKNPQNE